MCTKTIQNETAKRREVQEHVRRLAGVIFNPDDAFPDDVQIADAPRQLVLDLGIRKCCLTYPGDQHGQYGRECNRG